MNPQFVNGLKNLLMKNDNSYNSYDSYDSYPLTYGTSSTNSTSSYRFSLEKGSTKHNCPNCGKKRFVRYVDHHSNEYTPYKYGRCDREENCCYHCKPSDDGYGRENWDDNANQYAPNLAKTFPSKKRKATYPFSKTVLFETNKGYNNNVFIQNLLHHIQYPLPARDIESVIELYYLGTITKGYYKGALTIPFINIDKEATAIQVKTFDEQNHTIKTTFLHSILSNYYLKIGQRTPNWLKLYNDNDSKVNCMFGEHLLADYPNANVALVEAPKTAIIATLYFGFAENTNTIWLATYSLSTLSVKNCKALKGRKVLLFPDLSKTGSSYNLWATKIKEIDNVIGLSSFKVSSFLEENALEKDKEKGLDIADFLIKLDWREFRPEDKTELSFDTKCIKENNSTDLNKILVKKPLPRNLKHHSKRLISPKTIEKLKKFFTSDKSLKGRIEITKGETIHDLAKLVNSHLSYISNNALTTDSPYYIRLKAILIYCRKQKGVLS